MLANPHGFAITCLQSVAGRRHRYVYAAAAPERGVNSPQQAVVRVDTATGRVAAWRPGPLIYTGEPVLVPKACRGGLKTLLVPGRKASGR